MFDFDGDEAFFFFAAALVTLVAGFRYYWRVIAIPKIRASIGTRLILAVLPLVAILPTQLVLGRWADPQVAGHLDYDILFLLGAAASVAATANWMYVLGVSIDGDAIERNNRAALIASVGMLLGVGIVYAMVNIGSGPTIWTTIVPAAMGIVSLMLIWLIVALIGGSVVEAITIDRDAASALRLVGALLGCAIILGRAAAGKFESWGNTWSDFIAFGWPAAGVAVADGIAHRILRPTAARSKPGVIAFGVVPAVIFIAIGIVVLAIEKKGLHPSQW